MKQRKDRFLKSAGILMAGILGGVPFARADHIRCTSAPDTKGELLFGMAPGCNFILNFVGKEGMARVQDDRPLDEPPALVGQLECKGKAATKISDGGSGRFQLTSERSPNGTCKITFTSIRPGRPAVSLTVDSADRMKKRASALVTTPENMDRERYVIPTDEVLRKMKCQIDSPAFLGFAKDCQYVTSLSLPKKPPSRGDATSDEKSKVLRSSTPNGSGGATSPGKSGEVDQ